MSNNKTILSLLFVGLIFCMSAFAGDDKTGIKSDKYNPLTKIEWLSYDEGLAKAKKEDKHLFIYFTTKWCVWCKKMDKTTFIEPEIVKMLNNHFVAIKIWGGSKNYKVRGYPTFWFLDPSGTKLGTISGYQSATSLKNHLEFVKDKKYEEKNETDK